MPPDPAAGIHPRHARLARQIVAAAIADGWRAGTKVTEQDLAARLAVSRSPVRAALRLLAARGVLSARRGRGYMLAVGAAKLGGFTLAAPQAPDERLHDALVRDRLAGRIGARIAQASIGRRYDIGLPTVLRVLQRMEQEGLLTRNGSQWQFVPTLDGVQSRRASYELRLMVEPAALLTPGFRAAPAAFRLLRAEHVAMLDGPASSRRDPAALFDLDARFHEVLAQASCNPFVVAAIRQQNTLRRLLELASYRNRARTAQWLREHIAILDALLRDDRAAAAMHLREHLERAAHGAEVTVADVLSTGSPLSARRIVPPRRDRPRGGGRTS